MLLDKKEPEILKMRTFIAQMPSVRKERSRSKQRQNGSDDQSIFRSEGHGK